MKKFSISLLFAAAALFAAAPACSEKEELFPEEGDGIVLRFFSDESMVVTKATTQKEGVDALNENVLSSVEYFIYSNAQKNGNAVLHGYLENVRQNAPVSIPMTIETVNSVLCPNGATNFWVYAIANRDRIVAAGDPENLSGTDIATISALTKDMEIDEGIVKTPQSNFLMSTEGPFEVTNIKRRSTIVATANIGLKRVAAKITVAVRVVPQVTIKNTVTISGVTDTRTEIWKPRLNEMYIFLVNGAKTGQVSGAPVAGSDLYQYQQVGFDMNGGESHSYDTYTKRVDGEGNEILDANGLVQYDKTTETGIFYPSNDPFYTYPEKWMYGSEEEPYLKLAIPWDREAGVSDNGLNFGATSKIYYYRVYCPATPIDISNAQFLRNNWYKVILNVGILGSETDGGAMVINGNYYVVDWQERETGGGGSGTGINDSDKEAEIKGARYLFLNEQNFIMYNLEDLMIPYVTSDPCIIENFSAKKYDFSGTTKQEVNTTSQAAWNMDVSLVTTATGAHIKFNHPLNNDTSTDDYDVSPYIITFTIRHKDDPSYAKEVRIEQRPAIMIDMETNSDTGKTNHGNAFVNGAGGAHDPYYYTYGSSLYGKYANESGTVRDNSRTGYKFLDFYLGSAPGVGTSSNSNYNMILIETSVLPSDSEYMLGDPRKYNVDNLNNTDWPANASNAVASAWSRSATSVQGSNRYLSYYYPTDPDDAANNIIAPKFRIASSWGSTQPMRYSDAFRRCASYQEDGYPAGRWRLPTVAEIQYIAKLNTDGKITRLLGSSSTTDNYGRSNLSTNYWCNSGYMVVYNGVNSDWPSNGNKIPSPEIGTDNPDAITDGSTYYVRCVYDDWYWDDYKIGTTDVSTVTKTTFTWGDIAR